MNVLVVDDREENRAIIRAKLGAEGYSVMEARNGFEGLRLLRANKVDLIITDLMMPGMDGYQFTHAVKTDDALRSIPVIVYTSTFTNPRDEALALNLGANAFILKPATDEEFFRTIRSVLAKAERGELPSKALTQQEVEYLRQYTERLVRKLEDKVDELERAQANLCELNSTLERRVAEATAQLRQANEDLEAFAYSVSHDLRAPLRGIEGYVSAVADANPPLPPDEQKDFLGRASRLALQAQTMISDVLEFARLNAGAIEPGPASLDEALRAALDRLEPEQRANARIEIRPISAQVLGHHATLVQVIQNLLSNALKFTASGAAPHIVISEEPLDGWIRLSIRDHGIGIDPKHRDRVFKVFERLHDKRTYAGSGLGLAIVQRAIQKMGGRLGFESNPGEGSTFWFELPRAT